MPGPAPPPHLTKSRVVAGWQCEKLLWLSQHGPRVERPDLTYNDLAIVDGQVASVEIARLLFVAHLVEDRDQLRRDLLAYCERDTWAMVRLLQRLRELAG